MFGCEQVQLCETILSSVLFDDEDELSSCAAEMVEPVGVMTLVVVKTLMKGAGERAKYVLPIHYQS